MDLAITFGQLNPAVWRDAALAADELGYESVWLPEHLVLPERMEGELRPGEEHPPVPPDLPVFDVGAFLGYLTGITTRVRLGTFVYLLGIRHPFVGARTFATLDVLSGGRVELGVGVGWLRTEWEAAGLDPSTRGPRLDEAIAVTRRLWTEDRIAHDGEFWSFPSVGFEPKPLQAPHPPILIGGESPPALRRAAALGDGWIGMEHTPGSAAARVGELTRLRNEHGTADRRFTVTVLSHATDGATLEGFRDAGVDRLIVVPWRRSRDAVAAMHDLAARAHLAPTTA